MPLQINVANAEASDRGSADLLKMNRLRFFVKNVAFSLAFARQIIVYLRRLSVKRVADPVAQLVEQYTFNVWVLGSSPSRITFQKSLFQSPG